MRLEDIDREIARTSDRLRELQRHRDRLTYPTAPVSGSVVVFHVQRLQAGPVDKYAAIGVNGQWAVSGHSGFFDWGEVVDIMRQDYSVASGAVTLSFLVAGPGSMVRVNHG